MDTVSLILSSYRRTHTNTLFTQTTFFCNFSRNGFHDWSFPGNFGKFYRTAIFKNSLGKIFPTHQQQYCKNNIPFHHGLGIGRQKTKSSVWEVQGFTYMGTTEKIYKSLNSCNVRGEIWRRSVRSFTVLTFSDLVNRLQRLAKTVNGKIAVDLFIKKLPNRYFTREGPQICLWSGSVFSV